MDIVLVPLFQLILTIANLYRWGLIIYIILQLLEAFHVINTYNEFVYGFKGFLVRLYEPVLEAIRRVVPVVSGIDLSPLVLLFALAFVMNIFERIMWKLG